MFGMVDGPYEEIDASFEYLNLSGRNLGLQGVLDILKDVAGDKTLKQLDLGYNISIDEFRDRKKVELFFRSVRKMLVMNHTLTGLELAGNNLFRYHPHPANEHLKNYEIELVKILTNTKITHLDISDNNVSGDAGRELKGLTQIMNFMRKQGLGLKCKLSKLNSQGFFAISNSLGVNATLTYLDLSHNFGGLDPAGKPNSEGIAALSLALSLSLHMRVLKLAYNHLGDDDVVLICDALQRMPQFQDLDIAGNLCHTNGARALKLAIISHSIFDTGSCGFRNVDISNNPLGEGGGREIAGALHKTHTLKSLKMKHCAVNGAGMLAICETLKENATIVDLLIEGNLIDDDSEERTLAEVEATRHVCALRDDPHAVDAGTLSVHAYKALSRKFKFMKPEELIKLHENLTLNQPETIMQEALHLLQPPPRNVLIKGVVTTDASLQRRLQESALVQRKLLAGEIISRVVMGWYEPYRIENNLQRALLKARMAAEKRSAHNKDDDTFQPVIYSGD